MGWINVDLFSLEANMATYLAHTQNSETSEDFLHFFEADSLEVAEQLVIDHLLDSDVICVSLGVCQ